MSKLTIWKKSAPAKTEAKPAADPRSFHETMQALQAASGHVPRRIIPMRCAVHDKPYAVVFHKPPPYLTFIVERVITQAPKDAPSSGLLSRHFSGQGAERKSFDWSEFSLAGASCPWCGNDTGTVYCSDCKENLCYGTVEHNKQNGEKRYRCTERCGSKGVLVPADKVRAHNARPLKGHRAHTATGIADSTAQLPGGGRALLPGK